jgi:general secretion pathway protein J
MSGAGREAGFTLLEVVIGAALLGMMMLLLTGSLRIGAESWDAGEERMARASRLFVVENFLRSHIGSLLPVVVPRGNGELEPPLQGGPDFLEYVAPLPEQVQAAGLYRFRLYLSKNGERQDLRVAIIPYRSGPDKGETIETLDDLPLVEGVAAFKLAYLPLVAQNPGLLGRGDPPKWTEEWRNPQLPALIKVEIEPENEEPWPTLVVAPKTQILR